MMRYDDDDDGETLQDTHTDTEIEDRTRHEAQHLTLVKG